MDQHPPKRRGRPPKSSNTPAKPQKKSKGKVTTERRSGRQPRSLAALLGTSSTSVASLGADYQITLVDVTASYNGKIFTVSGLRRGMLDIDPWSAEQDDLEESPPVLKRSIGEDKTIETAPSRSNSKRRRISSDSDSDISFGKDRVEVPTHLRHSIVAEQRAKTENQEQASVAFLTQQRANASAATSRDGPPSPSKTQTEKELSRNIFQKEISSRISGQSDVLPSRHGSRRQTPSAIPVRTAEQHRAEAQFRPESKVVKVVEEPIATAKGVEDLEHHRDKDGDVPGIEEGKATDQATKTLRSNGLEAAPMEIRDMRVVADKSIYQVPAEVLRSSDPKAIGSEVLQTADKDAYRRSASVLDAAQDKAEGRETERRQGEPAGRKVDSAESGCSRGRRDDIRRLPEEPDDGMRVGLDDSVSSEGARAHSSTQKLGYLLDTPIKPEKTALATEPRPLAVGVTKPTGDNTNDSEILTASRGVRSTPDVKVQHLPRDMTPSSQEGGKLVQEEPTERQAMTVQNAAINEVNGNEELRSPNEHRYKKQQSAIGYQTISDDGGIPGDELATKVQQVGERHSIQGEAQGIEKPVRSGGNATFNRGSHEQENLSEGQVLQDWVMYDQGRTSDARREPTHQQPFKEGHIFSQKTLDFKNHPHFEQRAPRSENEEALQETTSVNAPQVPEIEMRDADEGLFERLSGAVKQTILHEPQSEMPSREGDGWGEEMEVDAESAGDSGKKTARSRLQPPSLVESATSRQPIQTEPLPDSKECPICGVDYTELPFKEFEQHVANCVDEQEAQYSGLSDDEQVMSQHRRVPSHQSFEDITDDENADIARSHAPLSKTSADIDSPSSDSQRTVSESPPAGGDDDEVELPGPYDGEDDEWVTDEDEAEAETSLGNNSEEKVPTFKKIMDPERFRTSLANTQAKPLDEVVIAVDNAVDTMVAWQAEFIRLDKEVAKALHRKAQNPRAQLDPIVFEDQKEADLYGYKWDPNPKKRGMQDPIGQRLGRFVGGRELRRRAPATKSQLVDSDVGTQEGSRRTRGKKSEGASEVNGLSMRSEDPIDADTPEQSDAPKKRGRPRLNPLPARIQNIRDEDNLSGTSTESEGTPAPSAKRRGRPPKESQTSKVPAKRTPRANPWASQTVNEQEKAKAGEGDGSGIQDPLLQPAYGVQKKPKSLKRSHAMTAWWAKRKSEQAVLAEASAAAAEGSDADTLKGRSFEKSLSGGNSSKSTKAGIADKNNTPVPQKRRGRPPKQSSLGTTATTETDETSSQPKRRGRPPGAPNKTPRTKSTLAMTMDGANEGYGFTQASDILNYASPYQQPHDNDGNANLGRRRRHESTEQPNRGNGTSPDTPRSDSEAILVVESSDDAGDDDGDGSYYGN